ncbi:MAG TPA: DUF4231 domain-containing protein [Thermoanaerobaculia bacterium]|nr:DUF4231 domain-containing protein [Thermoanaerobaculia bacterium]
MPALHDAANAASTKAQRQYLLLTRLNLIALLIGAGAGTAVPAVAAIALIAALVITLLTQNKSYERTWYGGRAIAESVKTLAWRYMTRAEPFQAGDDELFLERLAQLLQSAANLDVRLTAVAGADQITPHMRKVRGWPLAERRDHYDEFRIQDQQKWYAGKSALSERAERLFFTAMWISNGLAVAAAVCAAFRPDLAPNATSLFSTVAAVVFAWLQVKRHQELAQSYAIAAQELSIVHGKVRNVTTDPQFAAFVADAENAISREHILWTARRDAAIAVR